MQIQKQVSKKVGDKVYYKYVLVIPNQIIREMGVGGGEEFDAEAGKGELNLKKKRKNG